VLAYCTEHLLRERHSRLVTALLIATNLLVYPMSYASRTIVYYLPLYGVFLGNF
jgi:hypothetical protein